MRRFVFIFILTALVPVECLAKQYYYKCQLPNDLTEYTINTSNNSVKQYSYERVREYPLLYSTPEKFVWKWTYKNGPRRFYNRTIHKESDFTLELNRVSLILKSTIKEYDYETGEFKTYKSNNRCYEVN